MALVSQNGWPASGNKRDINVRTFRIGDVSFVGGVRHGDVETVLRYVAEQFNARVERFVNPGCWGWAFREIRGGSKYSNHASGTAIDFNAPRHPLGVEGTFTAEQRAIGASILDSVDNVVRWGEFYRGRVDGMHLEINAGPDRIHEIAQQLLGADMPLSDEDLDRIADRVFNRTFVRQGNRGGHAEGSITSLGAICAWWDHVNSLADLNYQVPFVDMAGNERTISTLQAVNALYRVAFHGGEGGSNNRSFVRHLEDLEALLIAEGDMPTEMLAAITRLSNSINAAIEKANGTVD